MASDAIPSTVPTLLVIDLIDEASGLAEVEDEQGRTYAFPSAWLPAASDGQAYRVSVSASGVQFALQAGGAALMREKSKQTLLEFSDEFGELGGDSGERS